jgi:hypothetical protein
VIADLRRVDSDTPENLRRVIQQMDERAQESKYRIARSRPQEVEKTKYHLWRYGRKKEFEALYQACRREPGFDHLSGDSFLGLLHQFTLKEGTPKWPTEDERINRFELHIPGVIEPVQVLRRLDSEGALADLRLLPSVEEEGHVIDVMRTALRLSESHTGGKRTTKRRRTELNSAREWSIWRLLGPALQREFDAYRSEKAVQAPYKRAPTAAAFVRHLAELCEQAGGEVVDAESSISRHRVVPEGSKHSITVLLRVDRFGVASIRRISDDLADEAQTCLAMKQQIREPARSKQANRADASNASDSSERGRPSKRRRTEQAVRAAPQRAAGELRQASELKQVLELMIDNRRSGRPWSEGMKSRTGLEVRAIRSWVKSDGSLARRRTANSLQRLEGFFELRDQLHALLVDLGHEDLANRLPQPMTARLLSEALQVRLENPQATTAARLACLVKANTIVIRNFIDASTGELVVSGARISGLPDYEAYSGKIQQQLQALGHVDQAASLRPMTRAESFLQALEKCFYFVANAAAVMREHPELSPEQAAARMEAERHSGDIAWLVTVLVEPGGRLRDVNEIAQELRELPPNLRQRLDSLVRHLASPGRARMTAVLKPSNGPEGGKLFIAKAHTLARGEARHLSTIFAHNPELVRRPRSYQSERGKQTLRWLSTVLKSTFSTTEVQCYHDTKREEIWVSSNDEAANRRIHDFLSRGDLQRTLDDLQNAAHESRENRHAWKLARALADPSVAAPEARHLLEAISAKRFRVPIQPFYDNGIRILLHAERRIKRSFEQEYSESLDCRRLAGTMRPCGICAHELGLPDTAPRGPFWLSRPGQAFADTHAIVQENIAKGIGSYATRTVTGALSVHHDTDSDSGPEESRALQLDSKARSGWSVHKARSVLPQRPADPARLTSAAGFSDQDPTPNAPLRNRHRR